MQVMLGFNHSHISTDRNYHVLHHFIPNDIQRVKIACGLASCFMSQFIFKMPLSNQCILGKREENCKFTTDLFRINRCRSQHTRELISTRKYVTQVQQQSAESPTVTLTRHACKYKVHKLHQRYMLIHKLHQRYMLLQSSHY